MGDDPDNEAEVDKLEEEEWKGLKEKPLCAPEKRITIESFMEWKKRFDDELGANGTLKRGETKAKSGRAIFMEAQAAEGSPKDGSAKGDVAYNAALFGEEDDADLDDLDDEDEEPTSGGYPN